MHKLHVFLFSFRFYTLNMYILSRINRNECNFRACVYKVTTHARKHAHCTHKRQSNGLMKEKKNTWSTKKKCDRAHVTIYCLLISKWIDRNTKSFYLFINIAVYSLRRAYVYITYLLHFILFHRSLSVSFVLVIQNSMFISFHFTSQGIPHSRSRVIVESPRMVMNRFLESRYHVSMQIFCNIEISSPSLAWWKYTNQPNKQIYMHN